MRSMRIAGLVSTVALTAVMTASLTQPSAQAASRRGFSERDLRGTYSAFFEGEVTDGFPVLGPVVAVGLLKFDGRGNFVVHRTLNIAGEAILRQRSVCTVSVHRNGSGQVECVVSTPGFPDLPETFEITLVSGSEIHFASTTPGLVVVGLAKKQSRPGR